MFTISINENQIIRLSLMASLLIHGLIFAFSGKTFIHHVEYSVQPSTQEVEVSYVSLQAPSSVNMSNLKTEALGKETANASFSEAISKRTNDSVEIATQPAVARNDKYAAQSRAGVRVKANPDYFRNLPPEYPSLAKQMQQEGLVLLSVDVNQDGLPIKVAIIRSSGFRMLDQAAFKAVSHWKFQPGRIGNIAIESEVTVPVRFYLEK